MACNEFDVIFLIETRINDLTLPVKKFTSSRVLRKGGGKFRGPMLNELVKMAEIDRREYRSIFVQIQFGVCHARIVFCYCSKQDFNSLSFPFLADTKLCQLPCFSSPTT